MVLSERDNGLVNLRPKLAVDLAKSGEIETFQGETLRPILKFQSSIILAQFKRYIQKFKPAFMAYSQSAQRNFIEDVMKRDPKIKNSLIASVVSLMTLEEYDFYCGHKIEINKRIVGLLTTRIQDSISMLY